MTEYLQSFMPLLSSEKGHLGDELNGWVHILMFMLMAGWGIFFIYCLFRFSSSNNPKAKGLIYAKRSKIRKCVINFKNKNFSEKKLLNKFFNHL